MGGAEREESAVPEEAPGRGDPAVAGRVGGLQYQAAGRSNISLLNKVKWTNPNTGWKVSS